MGNRREPFICQSFGLCRGRQQKLRIGNAVNILPLWLQLFGKDRDVRSIELFAGAGGLALGTAKAGFRHGTVIEWDADACNTIRRPAS
jgi:hypothetical protein